MQVAAAASLDSKKDDWKITFELKQQEVATQVSKDKIDKQFQDLVDQGTPYKVPKRLTKEEVEQAMVNYRVSKMKYARSLPEGAKSK
jgi:hypothetical protein